MLGAALGDRECAEPNTTLPHHPGLLALMSAASPLSGTSLESSPTAFQPPWTPVFLLTPLVGCPPCSSPQPHVPREHTRAPGSRVTPSPGRPMSESSTSHSELTRGPSSGGLLFLLSFLFYKEEVGFLPLGPLWGETPTKPRAEKS